MINTLFGPKYVTGMDLLRNRADKQTLVNMKAQRQRYARTNTQTCRDPHFADSRAHMHGHIMAQKLALTWVSEMDAVSLKTIHSTVSEHGGVVRDPL